MQGGGKARIPCRQWSLERPWGPGCLIQPLRILLDPDAPGAFAKIDPIDSDGQGISLDSFCRL